MASVQDVIAINSRPGNSEKGGSQTYGITVDASPFQRLAEYTYLDNVEKTKAKTIKDQAIATEMGKSMALDINTTNKDLYDDLDKQKKDILYLVQNNKDVFDYNKNPEANRKYQELYGQFTANRAKATAFDTLNNAAVEEIAKIQDPSEQQSARTVLENNRKISLVGGAGNFFKYGTQLETGLVKFTADDFKVPKVSTLDYTTVDILANNNKSTEVKVLDANAAWSKAGELWLGIQDDKFVPQANPNKDPAIDLRNQNAKIQSDAKNAKKGRFSSQTLEKMNVLLSEYNDKKKAWDANPVGKEPEKTDQIKSIDAINENLIAANAALGKARAKDPSLKVPDFNLITYNDPQGLTGQELVYLETLSGQEGKFIDYVEKLTSTDNAIQIRGQNMTSATADKDRAERKAARVEKNLPPLPDGAAADKGNIIYSINSPIKGNDPKYKGAKIVNGEILDAKGNLITSATDEMDIPTGKTGAYIQEWYKKYNNVTGGEGAKVQVTNGTIKAKFDNGKIVGILATNGGYITVDDFQKISDGNGQLKETKQNSETRVGVIPAGTQGGLP